MAAAVDVVWMPRMGQGGETRTKVRSHRGALCGPPFQKEITVRTHDLQLADSLPLMAPSGSFSALVLKPHFSQAALLWPGYYGPLFSAQHWTPLSQELPPGVPKTLSGLRCSLRLPLLRPASSPFPSSGVRSALVSEHF